MDGRGIVPYSDIVEREAKVILEDILERGRDAKTFSYQGWHGVGRWRIVEYAAKLAIKTNHFDKVIVLNQPINVFDSRRKLQLKIAEALGIPSETMDAHVETDIDVSISMQIYEKLKDKRFLLVLGSQSSNVSAKFDLPAIGVPNLGSWNGSRYVVISRVILVGYWLQNIEVDGEFSCRDFSASDILKLILEEVALAAQSSGTKGYFSPGTIMNILCYFPLCVHGFDYSFLRDREWMMRYWSAEGFLVGGEVEEKDDKVFFTEIMDALLTELDSRSLLQWDGLTVRMNSEVREVLILDLKMKGEILIFHHGSLMSKYGLPNEDDEREWENIQRMSVIITGDKTNVTIPPPPPKCPHLSTLILRFEKHPNHFEFPITFFDNMSNHRVLDLVGAPIESLPSSLSSLGNLKLLMLQSCKKLASLPTSLRDLTKLEFLNLSYCLSLNEIPENSFELMARLRILDLSETKIASLPSSLFSKLHNLQRLLLRNCRALKSLPPSLFSNLGNLKELNLSHCRSIKTGVSPQSLQNLTSLEELDLSGCEELQDIRDASFQGILPRLRRLNISKTQIPTRLSLSGCQRMETLDLRDLQNLEVLDVSSAKLKTLDFTRAVGKTYSLWKHTSVDSGGLNDYSLRRLDILPTMYSDALYEELNWRKDDDHARIWVSNCDFFEATLKCDSGFFGAPCFSRFYVCISPHDEEGCMPMTIDKFQTIQLKRRAVFYQSIFHSHTQTNLFSHFTSISSFDRHLEICRGNSSPQGVDRLLARTELITLLFNNSVERLTDLCDASMLSDLKECRIGGCQRIKNVFSGVDPDVDTLPSLKVVWVSDLPQLTVMCYGVYGAKSFALLKHIYVEHCPRLVTLFTSGVYFQSLETLEIRFCCRLENVFQQEVEGDEGSMQNLRSLCLLHVPKLKSICNGFLPRLEKVQVRRCPNLRKLPIQVSLIDTSPSLPAVEIRGETKWWKNLQRDNNEERNNCPARFQPWRHTPTTMLLCGLEW